MYTVWGIDSPIIINHRVVEEFFPLNLLSTSPSLFYLCNLQNLWLTLSISDQINLNTRIYDPVLGKALKPLREAMLKALPQNKDSRILNLFCGTGDQLPTFELAGYKSLYGIDLDPVMIAYAKRNSAIINYCEGDASKTNFPKAYFNVVTISLALHDKHQALRKAILREAARLIDMNGYILIADFAFDNKSKFLGRFLIAAVERFAGGEHYRNFKDYRDRGGTMNILPKNSFTVHEISRVVSNAIAIWKLKTGRPA